MPQLPPGLKAAVEATKATYKRLGNSGLLVSVPILGAMSFGSKEWQDWVLEEDEVSAMAGMLAKHQIALEHVS